MGAKNRERRQAKQKARQEQQRRREERGGVGPENGAGAGSPFAGIFGRPRTTMSPADVVEPIVRRAILALHGEDEETVVRCVAKLAEGPGSQRDLGVPTRANAPDAAGARRVADAGVFSILQRELSGVWRRGWQPVDVVRAARRTFGARHARVIVDVIAAEMRAYAAATVDERWEAQLLDLGATVWWERDDGYVSALGEREGLDRPALMRCLLESLYIFNTSSEIQILCPPPGKARRGSLGGAAHRAGEADPRQLDRVRALLAKAESTSFPEEAEAYTAKAQELMARHSIDYALLSVESGTAGEPVGRRIGVDNPYEAPKVLLLDAVASANRCRAIWSSGFGFVTVLGFPTDVDAVEMLFTSLLVQATSAMVREGARRDAYGRSRTRSFRQSFLTAYAQRIGERLTKATTQATEEASRDITGRDSAGRAGADRLLPVLASRDSEVRSMAEELFPSLVGRSVAVTNREGWASGRAAADNARLTSQRAVGAGS